MTDAQSHAVGFGTTPMTSSFWCGRCNKWHELKPYNITFTDCSVSGKVFLPDGKTRLGLIFKLIKSFI